ncbi:MAG: hypothetical protein KGZ81_06975 [Flavobacteriales bacterium]|nr:hypothetical protein [Flavobacteriales bacterium]
MKWIKKNIDFVWVFLSLVATFLLLSPIFEMMVFPQGIENRVYNTLDISWAVAHNYANFKDLILGVDFAFTHGPLSPLVIKIGWANNKWLMLLYDLFYFSNFFFLFYTALKKSKNKLITIPLIILALVTYPLYLGGSQSIVLFIFLFFWLNYSIEKPNFILPYFYQISILVLLFYIKFNTGLISFVLFYITIGYLFISKQINWKNSLLISILPLILTLFTSHLLNVSIVPYVLTALELISGYNEIMYLKSESFEFGFYKAWAFLLITVLFFIIHFWKKSFITWKGITFLLMYGMIWFVLYKQAFVRADEGHVYGFFNYLSVFLLSSPAIYQVGKFKWNDIFIYISILFIFFTNLKVIPDFAKKLNFNKSDYISGFQNFDNTFGKSLSNNQHPLPDNVLKTIGNKTIDIYPWDVMLLLENKLNYHPRPVIQSYSAYTKKLEQLNFDFYNNYKTAPEFIIYTYASVDNRYPIFDEPMVNLAIERNYHIKEVFDFWGTKMILMAKNQNFIPVNLVLEKEYAINYDSPLIPKEDKFYEVQLYNSFSGKLYKTFMHAPEISLTIKTDSHQISNFKTANSLLQMGVFGVNKVNSLEQYIDLHNKIIPSENKITYYKFSPLRKNFFKEKIRVKEYKIVQQ